MPPKGKGGPPVACNNARKRGAMVERELGEREADGGSCYWNWWQQQRKLKRGVVAARVCMFRVGT